MLQLGKKTIFIFLLIILAIAAFFRFYKLAEIPPGLYPDVAINANDALLALKTHDFKVFYPENNGREGLFINLIALSFYFFGVSVLSIKLVPAIIGTLTVLGMYLMSKELFGRISNFNVEIIALLSTFFLSISFWHINFSRLGFRAIMVPFFLVWSFYFLFKATRMTRTKLTDDADKFYESPPSLRSEYLLASPRQAGRLAFGENQLHLSARGERSTKLGSNKIIHWLLIIGYCLIAGLLFGLGFHTYIAFRVAPAILGVFFIIEIYNYWQVQKSKKLEFYPSSEAPSASEARNREVDNVKVPDSSCGLTRTIILPWLLFFIAALIAISPMLIYFYNNPLDFMGRTGQVSVFNSATPIKDLAISKIKTLGMFNFWGDCNWRHNFACQPQLPYAIGILFLFGLFRCIGEIIKTIYKYIKKIPELNQQVFFDWSFTQTSFFLLTWFSVMLSPAILTNEGLPHALRTIGVIPVIYIFIGIGGCWTYEKIKNYESKTKYAKKIIMFLLGLFFAWSIAYVYDLYFIRWGKNPEVKGAFAQNLVDIGNYLNNLPKNISKFVIVNENGVLVPFSNGVPMPAQTPMFIEKTKTIELKAIYILPEELNYFNNNNLEINHPIVFVLIKNDERILEILKTKFPAGEFKDENGVWAFMINPKDKIQTSNQ